MCTVRFWFRLVPCLDVPLKNLRASSWFSVTLRGESLSRPFNPFRRCPAGLKSHPSRCLIPWPETVSNSSGAAPAKKNAG